MKHSWLPIAMFAAFHVFGGEGMAGEHTKDSLDKVEKNLNEKKAVLLDVREKQEWDEGHLAGARLLPLSELQNGLDPKVIAKTLPKKSIVYCHCAAGVRVLPAAEILRKLGYDVRPLRFGYADLLGAGFEKAE